MVSRKKGEIAQETISRRSLLEWLGTGCVIALGAPLIQACNTISPTEKTSSEPPTKLDGGVADAKVNERGLGKEGIQPESIEFAPDYKPTGYKFEPGSFNHKVYKDWWERTIDPQDPKKIIATWKLKVDGMVESSKIFTFADLIGLPRTDMLVDFHCVEGWSIYDVPWNGFHISELIKQVKPSKKATHITFHTIDGKYNESLPLKVALEPKTLLTYGIGGSTIPLKHGFPLRLVIPRLLGYKNAKYVDRIEFTDKPVNGFWVGYGYPYDGEVPKGRLRPGKY